MLDHWNTRALDFLKPYLSALQTTLRVSSGFFTVEGYDLLRAYLQGKKVQILVGYDETSHKRLKEHLVDEIMDHLASWSIVNRREAVLDLVAKLQRGDFQLVEQAGEVIEARIRLRDHGKVYIFDDKIVFPGSANLTRNGLLYNTENLTAVLEDDRVKQYCETFFEYWNDARTQNLTQLLLDALLKWLELHIPFDVYLRTIQALGILDEGEHDRPNYKQPVLYQRVVIQRTLEQLKQYRGSIIVASTGLGKTVMATDVALRLSKDKTIFSVVVYAPKQIQNEWNHSFRTAGIFVDVRTRNNLDQPTRGGRGKIDEAVQTLESADDRTLIILDETQYFVNRLSATGDGDRLSFERLQAIVAEKSPYVLMLTATPMVKHPSDLNHQLLLLPHTAPVNTPNGQGQHHLFLPEDGSAGRPWTVSEHDTYFDEFVSLPVATVISTAYVAKTYATHTEQGDYLEFGDQKKWIPQVELFKIAVPVMFEREMGTAIDEHFFNHQPKHFKMRGRWQQSEDTILNQAIVAWTSSPAALQDVLEQVIGDEQPLYEVDFKIDDEQRRARLLPLLNQLRQMQAVDDVKAMQLCEILRQATAEQRKVIIFSERLATCVYLERMLHQFMPELNIANAVTQDAKGAFMQKKVEDVERLIFDFAPEANKDKIPAGHKHQPIDVFILTDAYGVGVNLQDASIVINYDLAWTPDKIIQRAGRVMRLWIEPRRVRFYVFTGKFVDASERTAKSRKVEQRLQKLVVRTQHAERFSEMPTIPDDDRVDLPSLAPLSNVHIESMGILDAAKMEEFTVSPFLLHLTALSKHQVYAQTIGDDFSSARTYRRKAPRMFLLLRYQGAYVTLLFDINNEQLEFPNKEMLLDLLQCDDTTPIAMVASDIIENTAQYAKHLWCKKQGIEQMDDVQRICALYLQPDMTADLKGILD